MTVTLDRLKLGHWTKTRSKTFNAIPMKYVPYAMAFLHLFYVYLHQGIADNSSIIYIPLMMEISSLQAIGFAVIVFVFTEFLDEKYLRTGFLHRYIGLICHVLLCCLWWPFLTWNLFIIYWNANIYTPWFKRSRRLFRLCCRHCERLAKFREKPLRSYWAFCIALIVITIDRICTMESDLLAKVILALNIFLAVKALDDDGAICLALDKYVCLKRALYVRWVVYRRRMLLSDTFEDINSVKIIEEMTGKVDEFSTEVVKNVGLQELEFLEYIFLKPFQAKLPPRFKSLDPRQNVREKKARKLIHVL